MQKLHRKYGTGTLLLRIPIRSQALILDPDQQVPQWLFAFDPAGMTTFRALALLATHPDIAKKAQKELDTDETQRQHLPHLRACILETLRLWPTTPMILRESTKDTEWKSGTMPENFGLKKRKIIGHWYLSVMDRPSAQGNSWSFY